MDSETLAIIKKTPVFSEINDRTLRAFVGQCNVIRYKAGSKILRPRQEADRFFLVLSGQVKIYKLSPHGDQQVLHLYGPGETFGEAAMWARIAFPAHAEAIEECRLLVVPRETLRNAFAGNAELAMGMLAGLSKKLREFNLLIERLSLKEVPARLADMLLEQAKKTGSSVFRLGQTKSELAAIIGTVPETLSRALAKLRKSGLIQVKGSEITICDLEALRDLAENG
jgi:CRP/FNR family transcriptional regulator